MGASRKLQGEIDRVLKKVQEGVDVFDSIWNKVYDTDNANQKEKFEADLKKEIKKLQRYRDQIKTWIQSSEIKDKKVSASYEQALVDARKLIEKEMERFKICEKETKTKAFSKEGLGQQPKTDPKEKAKSETRDWLNNVVGELESQIDSFEAELEGLTVKKGKTRPPRLTHLETSIVRHKAHIMKLELILRLLDNDELSPEQVNDVRDFLEDYVERNQEDFDEFSDVDDLYNTLPLDKVESLEDLVTIVPPAHVKGASAISLKNPIVAPAPQTSVGVLFLLSTDFYDEFAVTAGISSTHQQNTSTREEAEDTVSHDSNSEVVPKTPPPKSNILSPSAPSTPAGIHTTSPVSSSVPLPPHNLPGSTAPTTVLPSSSLVRAPLDNTNAANSSSTLPNPVKEEEIASFPARKPSPSPSPVRSGLSIQPPSTLGSNSVVPNIGVSSPSELAKRNILGGADERLGSSGLVQPLVSPLSNRVILPKAGDGTGSIDSTSIGDATGLAGRAFNNPLVPGMQWRPGSSLQNQNELFRGRTEIAPDQREKFLQKLQLVQQQNQNNHLGMPSLAGGNHKQFSAQQQTSLLQQFNSQSSAFSPQAGSGLGLQSPVLNAVSSAGLQQQPNSIHQTMMSSAVKDSEVGHTKVDEQQQQQNLPDDSNSESASNSALGKNLTEENLKALHAVDNLVGASGSLAEPTQVVRDIDLSPGQPIQSSQPSGGLGVIGRRSVSDLGTIGDTLSGPSVNSGGMHDQMFNLQMLEAAYYKLPQPKDSERPRTYAPRHPAATPPSYPQVQAPIINNPAFWDRLGTDGYGTDSLFFAFYYQQNTYQQYLAAKELKRQSWRFHRKYNTWFQRHEEPKVATDEYEQGTYVYFDFHIANDDLQHGWCQRIKTEFTFEYNYLEDELII
ncbi:hypothetical protein ACFE04_022041 [Oxalis oulophora]